jgi:hypothetical protein
VGLYTVDLAASKISARVSDSSRGVTAGLELRHGCRSFQVITIRCDRRQPILGTARSPCGFQRSSIPLNPNNGLSGAPGLSDEGDTSNNKSAAVSAVLVLKLKDQPWPYFLDQWVIHVGFEKTESMARKMVANIDHDVDTIRMALASQ